jgi:hypothetical protein
MSHPRPCLVSCRFPECWESSWKQGCQIFVTTYQNTKNYIYQISTKSIQCRVTTNLKYTIFHAGWLPPQGCENQLMHDYKLRSKFWDGSADHWPNCRTTYIPKNIPKFSIPRPSKCNKIGIFGTQICHLATLDLEEEKNSIFVRRLSDAHFHRLLLTKLKSRNFLSRCWLEQHKLPMYEYI